MNKTELINVVASKTDQSVKTTSEVINALLETIKETLANEEKVVVTGFGTFEVRTRAARAGKNPRTGEAIQIPEQKSPAFKAGKLLKTAVK